MLDSGPENIKSPTAIGVYTCCNNTKYYMIKIMYRCL